MKIEKIFPPRSNISISGIYKILFDDKYFYIGRSTNLYSRMNYWANKCGKKFSGENPKLRDIMHTFKKVQFFVLENCEPNIIKDRETFYLEKYWDEEFILNIHKNGHGPKGSKKTACRIGFPFGKTYTKDAPLLKPLSILKTEGEWNIILNKIKEAGKKDLSVFIRSEVRRIVYEHDKYPSKISRADGIKVSKRPYIPIDSYKKLEEISKRMKIPVSSVVDRLIIQPLLISPNQ